MLIITEPFQQTFRQLGLGSFDRIREYFPGGHSPSETGIVVKQCELPLADGGMIPVFYKQYDFSPPNWGFIGRRSKAFFEFRNYQIFQKLGIRSAKAIACGEERGAFGQLRRAFILTRAVPDAMTLLQLFQNSNQHLVNGEVRRARSEAIRQLALMTRQIHDARFFHNDLSWRNILVTGTGRALKVWWIDCPRGGFDRWSPLRRRRRIKDLALLERDAFQLCSPRDRLLFLKYYFGASRLSGEEKFLVQAVVDYRWKKWRKDLDPSRKKKHRKNAGQ